VSYWGAGTFSITTTGTVLSPMFPRRPAWRHGEPVGRRLLLSGLRSRWSSGPVRRQLRELRPEAGTAPGEAAYCRYNEIPVPCGPQGLAGGTNLLYRNRGDGTFEDVSEKSGIANPRGPSSARFVSKNWRPAGSYGMGAVAPISTTTAGRISTSPAIPHRACSTTTITTAPSAKLASLPAAP
jgi:hypothetical protein